MNNKGFAISAVLYTLLIAFLLFLAVTLSVFKSSARTIGNSNNDIIDGKTLRVSLVKNMNDYSGYEYGGCKDWSNCSEKGNNYTSGVTDTQENFAKQYYGCIKKGESKPIKQHYWYEYTKCSNPQSNGIYNFNTNCSVEPNQTLIKIDSVKGPMFWPRDFGLKLVYESTGFKLENYGSGEKIYKGIAVICDNGSSTDSTCNNKNYDSLVNGTYKIRVGFTTETTRSNIDATAFRPADTNYIGGVTDGTDKYIKLFDFCAN